MLHEAFDKLLSALVAAAREVYGDRLITVAVFGSVARGTMRQDSDVDLLLVAKDLPRGRVERVSQFEEIERKLEEFLSASREHGIHTTLCPVFKTPEEAEAGSPLFLDMTEDARLLYDRDGFFAKRLARLRQRLWELGAKRIWRGNVWYWDLKPDYKPGEVFEI